MNISITVDCSPEEARRFMGLPDLSPVHDVYLDKIKDAMANGISSETVESLMKNWNPMGEANMTFWRQMFDQMTKGGRST